MSLGSSVLVAATTCTTTADAVSMIGTNEMKTKVVPLTLGFGGRMEDVIGRVEFATEVNPQAELAYKLLKSGHMHNFEVGYIERPDGTKELTEISLMTNKPVEQSSISMCPKPSVEVLDLSVDWIKVAKIILFVFIVPMIIAVLIANIS